ncbi:hypothetical protein FQA39_LY13546 [Lamprigera yunnana]|nr:hypothetical protein FQA39_LY13546 [Lamprigera yunnana]
MAQVQTLLRTADVLSGPFDECVNHDKCIFSLQEVSHHDDVTDCWVIIYDRVYDVTDFLNQHPGGSEVLLEHAGRDASYAFRSTGHSKAALYALNGFYIGDLPLEERIYRRPGGFILFDLPK